MGLPERTCKRHMEAALERGDLDMAIEWEQLLDNLKLPVENVHMTLAIDPFATLRAATLRAIVAQLGKEHATLTGDCR